MSALSHLIRYVRFWGGTFYCNVCRRPVRRFFPFSENLQREAREAGFKFDFRRMETLNVDQCNCPFCLSNDRERLYLIFLDKFLQEHPGRYRLLDFAPNPVFASRLRAIHSIEYTSADLFRDDVDLKLDVCAMESVADGNFDIVICSHVLEHVPDPDKAMRELHRVLKSSGWAIIMVPLFWDLKETLENPAHVTPAARTMHYGQFDHVRLFSHDDFVARLSRAGFNVTEVLPGGLDATAVRVNAIAGNSVLYVCEHQLKLG